jgi:GT2 family glycosyltransferase
MITIIYSTHKDEIYNNKFKQHLLQTVGLKDVQVLEYVNHNQYSLSHVYNNGVIESIYDVVVCCHNDIKLEKNWGKKLLEDFSNNPEFGIIGKAGSCYFPESGVYWERMNLTMVGQVYHHPEGQKKWINRYSPKLPFLIPVVTIDGLFLSFDKTKIKHAFDETIGKFHFYDHLFCVPNYLDGVKIGVTSSFEITHESVGRPNQEFWESKEKFIEKWGSNLPLDLKPEYPYVPIIKTKPIKNVGKVAVIIPTKGNLELLFNCVDSLYEHCDKNMFDVFIADTGSTDEEKNKIKEKYLNYNINLIEYDYYNFAKINNDVVKNHIGKEYEFLLFCNNDIKILNNVIHEMVRILKLNTKVGVVGSRLHYEDNTLQHSGIFMYLNQIDKTINVTHNNSNSYFNYVVENNEVVGNTAALMMTRKDLFINIGMFNELYDYCWEDVELNLKCILKGYINIISGKSVAFHYESKTRNIDKENTEITSQYFNILIPFIQKNVDKLKKYFYIKQ